MATAKRRDEISRLNVLFCSLVLWIHCCSPAFSTLRHDSVQFLFVYLTHRLAFVSVYGFFLLSGVRLMLPRSGPAPSPLAYWKGRVRRLLLPYLLAVLVYYLWFVYVLRYFPFSWGDLAGYALRGDLSAPFYFLIALFQFTLLAPVFRSLTEHCSPLLLIPLSLALGRISGMYWNTILTALRPETTFLWGDRFFLTYVFYYVTGCCIGRNYDDFLRLLRRRSNRRLITAVFVLATACNAVLGGISAWTGRQFAFQEDFHQLYLISAILFLYMGSLRLSRPLPRFLAAADRASFLIYLYHSLCISAFDHVLELAAPGLGTGPSLLLRALFVYAGTSCACILWQRCAARVSARLRRTGPQAPGSPPPADGKNIFPKPGEGG